MGWILRHFLQPEASSVMQGNFFQNVIPQKYLQAFLLSINTAAYPVHCRSPYFNITKTDQRKSKKLRYIKNITDVSHSEHIVIKHFVPHIFSSNEESYVTLIQSR